MQAIVSGMGPFWKKITEEMFESLYVSTIPTVENIINCLLTSEASNHEAKIVTWLYRFIRSCSKGELVKFVRFITGASIFIPNMRIKVEFSDQPSDHICPKTQTCFKILTLARQYTSFTHFQQNISSFIFTFNPTNWSLHDN